MNLLDRFRTLDAAPPAGDLIAGHWTLGWSEALERSGRTAAWLRDRGLGPGDVLVVGLADDAEVTTTMLACLRSGVVPVFVDPGATAAEVRQVLGELEVAAMLVDADRVAGWVCDVVAAPYAVLERRAAPKRTLLSRWTKTKEALDPTTFPACLEAYGDADLADHAPSPEDLALILYTSGTSGGPKLVPLTRANLAAQAATMTRALQLDGTARVLNLMPITHVDGLLTGVLLSWWSGATMVRQPPFTIQGLPDVFDAIYRERVTHALLVPTILALMLRDEAATRDAFRTDDLRCVISTAASLAPELWERFESVTSQRVANMYGMSEIGNVVFAGPEEATRVRGRIGVPFDVDVRVVDDEGNEVPAGSTGELLVRGPSVMPGYLGRPTPWQEHAGDRWFPTGDLVRRDADGLLELVGRSKDIVITGGNNVAPAEVDGAMLSHPDVVEAATFGVPDATWGERLVACVVTRATDTDLDAIGRHVAERLAAFKVPRELHRVDELPKGRSGKVQVDALRGQVQQQAARGPDVEGTVFELAARCFHVRREDLELGTGPGSCEGWDSMAHLDFVVGLERAFELRFSPREVMRLDSLGAAVDHVHAHRGQPT